MISTIMDRKAVSEFRWTSVEEIVSLGGAMAMIEKDDYEQWFNTLPEVAREKVCLAWGAPPGTEMNGVPAAMVHDGRIVVTGVSYGNAIVCVQPKRGCAGARCDGQVCRILHDPEVAPPHQYLATYHWIEETFGADVMVHVGTHGNMEFLPGKSVALSESCFPDIASGDIPYLYIYNSDNPPEGAIAKRRSYAVIVDHMQTVMTEAGTYGELKDLEDKIAEYDRTKASEKARAHAQEHIILDLLNQTNLAGEIGLDAMLESGATFPDVLRAAHAKISEMYSTRIPDGMHIFGEVHSAEKRVEFSSRHMLILFTTTRQPRKKASVKPVNASRRLKEWAGPGRHRGMNGSWGMPSRGRRGLLFEFAQLQAQDSMDACTASRHSASTSDQSL